MGRRVGNREWPSNNYMIGYKGSEATLQRIAAALNSKRTNEALFQLTSREF